MTKRKGIFLDEKESAIVTKGDELELYTSNHRDMDRITMYLIAVFLRWQDDPEFVDDVIEWVARQNRH